jgi:signal transduction histidine kinase
MKSLAVFILLALLTSLGYGKPIPLPAVGVAEVSKDFSFLADRTASLQLTDFLGGQVTGTFKPISDHSWQEEVKVYWLRFSVINTTGFDGEWVFDFDKWAFVDFYYQDDTQWTLKKTGHLYPFRKRDYALANNNYINAPLKNGEVVNCLVRLESRLLIGKIPQNLTFQVAPKALADEVEAQDSKIIFSFLGAFSIMFLFNAFVYISTRLKAYAFYLMGLFFAAFHTAGNAGYIFPLFGWADSFPHWFYNFNLVSSNFWGVVYILFVQNLLKIDKRYPVWNKVLRVFLYAYIITGGLIFFHFDAGFLLTQVLGLATILAVLFLGIKSVKDRYPSATFFLLGNAALLLGILTIIFTFSGILPNTDFTYKYALPLGTTFEILFFSFALANMINVLRKENEVKQNRIIDQLQENQQLQTKVKRELEQKVLERTNELSLSLDHLKEAQNKLVQKEKMASLGELTAGIAHEIQNPLNFVTNFSEVSLELVEELKEGPVLKLPADAKEMANELLGDIFQNLQKINSHGRRADNIVKGLMDHSRSRPGELQLADINLLARESLQLAYQNFLAKNLSFSAELIIDFDQKIQKVEMVPQDIKRVLMNLFTNAFYAIREKSLSQENDYQPQVRVSTRLMTDKVELRVKDNGTGIPKEILNKIYQPFFTTKPTGTGTGLGLFLSYDIITKGHGGEITVNSEARNFTEFIISLPYQKKPAPLSA